MIDKEKYIELCKTEKSIPIFSKDWWMDAVCGEINWDVLLVERNNEIVASMPYYMKKKLGFKYITQPTLTKTNGVWIKYPEKQKQRSKLSYEKELMTEIIEQLKTLKIDYYSQNFNYSITNWLPFYWKGFKQTTRYTYVIENVIDLESVFGEFSKVVRKNIKKAEQSAKIYVSNDVEKFYSINKKTFERQGLKIPYTLELLKRIDEACDKNNARTIYFAEDEDGNLHCGSYIVYDDMGVYQLMSGTNPEFKKSEFKSLLIWEGLKYAHQTNRIFDFEGSMMEGVEEYFRKFGTIQKPFFSISKINSRILKIRQNLKF
ncbi:GNAT family N-acetyltransferase [Clostridium tagluense]|uniref:BioF2-like acetyltransferase domain-containing protein n=1 Tax=Clostridium tagluense TaxID=360422 RepID=A0A401UJM1_9CLOT|nr:GNAT family N-acetyltransferase [Clostridium tagluense]GCD09728.1 hypothetical protein Ctaglu_13510 [Clostridium tagluense]